MAPVIGKRKRAEQTFTTSSTSTSIPSSTDAQPGPPLTLQIITGSYERVLHGITAQIPAGASAPISFSNNFLFNAHSSSIRCLAVSPVSEEDVDPSSKRILATGSTDERINLYQISDLAPNKDQSVVASILPALPLPSTSSNNRELGSLLHHTSAITALHFPSRNKLLSASLDNNIAISRVRDWTVLSTIRAPVPKPVGRPSGDTAASGEVPAGINAVAVHPTAKLCISVGQGERCMRLWNLVTGKKAGVLAFERNILNILGEGRWRGGEGRQVVWTLDGEEFVVGFEKGALVYGLDCAIRGIIKLPGSKVCQIKYLPATTAQGGNVVVLSTEDGRVLFYKTGMKEKSPPAVAKDDSVQRDPSSFLLDLVASLGPNTAGPRIKDFEILSVHKPRSHDSTNEDTPRSNGIHNSDATFAIITGSSDGTVRVWKLDMSDVASVSPQARLDTGNPASPSATAVSENASAQDHLTSYTKVKPDEDIGALHRAIGTLLGTLETGRRITCLTAFVMRNQPT